MEANALAASFTSDRGLGMEANALGNSFTCVRDKSQLRCLPPIKILGGNCRARGQLGGCC
jgi:hypothetical protein